MASQETPLLRPRVRLTEELLREPLDVAGLDLPLVRLHDVAHQTADLLRIGDGERGAAQVAQLRFEVAFCERYLPKGLDETELRALVGQRLAALGIADPKQVGRLVGDIMKTHKGQVEAADVKRIAEELLGKV